MTRIDLRIKNSELLAEYWQGNGASLLHSSHMNLRLGHIDRAEGYASPSRYEWAFHLGQDATKAFWRARNCRLDAERLRTLIVTNAIAEQIVAEIHSSGDLVYGAGIDMLVSLHNRDDTRGAEIAVECLRRVLPNITADEHHAVVSDVLRYVDGDCLDCVDVNGWGICKH
jgi:hypothetical protein